MIVPSSLKDFVFASRRPLRDISHYTLFQKVLQIAFCKVIYKACRAYFQGFRIIETATRDNNRP